VSNERYLVVGAGPGVSFETAVRMAEQGAHVALIGRTEQRLAELTDDLHARAPHAPRAVWAAADAAEPDSLSAAIHDVTAQIGAPTIAHFNVSEWIPGGPLDVTPEQVAHGLMSGCIAGLVMAQAVAPAMLVAGIGTILFTGGGTADTPMNASTALGLQKAALRNLALALDKAWRPKGIHVAMVMVNGSIKPGSALDPGLIADSFCMLAAQTGGDASAWQSMLEM
jgi:NAD(P)-dependent dehydrogenase (short-subunit alcohol dehydrogenase family)